LVTVLADMQIAGFKADKDKLNELSGALSAGIKRLEGEIHALAGHEFNIGSPKQLGVVLFEELGLPVAKKTKTGYSTDADVLAKLAGRHVIIEKILEYRALAKLKSTYIDGLLAVINEKTGKIHSSFKQTVTTTGRISSADPNLQNIPVRTEAGRNIRRVFIAESDEYTLMAADYSQIELRVLAHMADDKRMLEAFANDEDIHAITASECFGVPLDLVSDEMRRRAKAVNFGIVYGIGDFSLAQDLGVTRKEAKSYIENYLATYSGIAVFMKKAVESARESGFALTLMGRRRYIPELTSPNFQLRAFGERAAMNAPIQGSAADIIKIAMVRVHRALGEKAPKSKLILQVHDELIVQAHQSERESVAAILKEEMESAYPLKVKLVADVKAGKSWYDTK
jgi:DNA polymerase-1